MNLGKWAPLALASILISACNQPNPPAAATPASDPPPPATPARPTPAAATPASPAPAASTPASPSPPPGPITENLPPSKLDYNPPGTPGYIIAPGNSIGPRNSQIIQPGGRPAF
jgi:hypothetical protein